MTRSLTIGAAQMGPVQYNDTRQSVVSRLIELMREAHSMGCRLVVYPELALTTFFPRVHRELADDPEQWFEHEMPNAATRTARCRRDGRRAAPEASAKPWHSTH